MRNWTTWIKAAGIRAMITEVGWGTVLGTAALAAVASLLTSLAGIPEEELS